MLMLLHLHCHRAIPEKKQTRGVEDMEFHGLLKKENVEIPGIN